LKSKQGVVYNIGPPVLHQMHELGVTENIVNIALAKAGEAQASKVIRINLIIGEMSGFVPDCIQFYFDTLSKDTITQGAVLNCVVGIVLRLSTPKILYGRVLNAGARA
jgi:hypothetical protein